MCVCILLSRAGVFNGVSNHSAPAGPSTRAHIPAPHSVLVEGVTADTYVGSALDLARGLVHNRTRVPHCGGNVTVTHLAHQAYRNVMLLMMMWSPPPGAVQANSSCTVQVRHLGVPMNASSSVPLSDATPPGAPYQAWQGHTALSERPGVTPTTAVAFVFDPVPAAVTFTASRPSAHFLFVGCSSLESAAVAKSPLDAALAVYKQHAATPPPELVRSHMKAWAAVMDPGIEIHGNLTTATAVNSTLYYILSSVRPDFPFGMSPGGIAVDAYHGHTFWVRRTRRVARRRWALVRVPLCHARVCCWSPLPRRTKTLGCFTACNCCRPPSARRCCSTAWTVCRLRGDARRSWASLAQTGRGKAPSPASTACRRPTSKVVMNSTSQLTSSWRTGSLGTRRATRLGCATSGRCCRTVARFGPPGSSRMQVRVVCVGLLWFTSVSDGCMGFSVGTTVVRRVTLWMCIVRATAGTCTNYTVLNVQPPDESAGVVNSSVYTNAAAAASLEFCVEAAGVLQESVPANWTTIAANVYIPLSDSLAPGVGVVHPEYDGYSGQRINQADASLLQFPLRRPMPANIARNDLVYYNEKIPSTGMYTGDLAIAVAWLLLGNRTAADASWETAFAHMDPHFNVWKERTTGGHSNFLTGGGAFLQAIFMGYAGVHVDNGVAFNPRVPPGATGMTLRAVWYLDRRMRVTYDDTHTDVELVAGAAGLCVGKAPLVANTVMTLPPGPFSVTEC